MSSGNRSLIALPHDGLKITCTSADDREVHVQHLSIDIDPENYMSSLPARTFTLYEDIEELLKMGKIRGGSLDSAVVIKGDQIMSKEPLRFEDEFVRHKILDVVGDLSLLRKPLHAHIIAVRPGHALNSELAAKILEHASSKPKPKPEVNQKSFVSPEETQLDVRRVLDVLPHRYPFVMIDRVVEIDGDQSLVARIKNVTINEPIFYRPFSGTSCHAWSYAT